MTGEDVTAARETLGLSRAQLAKLMGYGSPNRISDIENPNVDRHIDPRAERLLRAYLEGYRPKDWNAIVPK